MLPSTFRVQGTGPIARSVGGAPGDSTVTVGFVEPLARETLVLHRTMHVFGRSSGAHTGFLSI
jgi:hypothetical protein